MSPTATAPALTREQAAQARHCDALGRPTVPDWGPARPVPAGARRAPLTPPWAADYAVTLGPHYWDAPDYRAAAHARWDAVAALMAHARRLGAALDAGRLDRDSPARWRYQAVYGGPLRAAVAEAAAALDAATARAVHGTMGAPRAV